MSNGRLPNTSAASKVLILGDDQRMVLPIVRSLGRHGIEVHLAWCDAASPVGRSRYTKMMHRLPRPAKDDDRWTAALDALIDKHDFVLVIPAVENAVFALQNTRHRLRRQSRVYLLDDDVFRAVSDKQATYQLCEQLQIPIPKTERLSHPEQFEALLEKFGLPLIVKPCCSLGGESEHGKDYVRVCHTADDARQYISYLQDRGIDMMLQQFCPGDGVGVELLAEQGDILVAMQHRRLHETTGHGSTYRQTTALDPRLLDACGKLMRRLNYTGVAMVEFRVDADTGGWALLEINGRFWGSLPLAVAAGVDFPWHLFEMLVEQRREFHQPYRIGLRSRALTNDVRWLWRRATGRGKRFDASQAHNLGWVANDTPWSRLLVDTWRAVTFQDHVDAFARDDVYPAVLEIKNLLKTALSSLWIRIIPVKK